MFKLFLRSLLLLSVACTVYGSSLIAVTAVLGDLSGPVVYLAPQTIDERTGVPSQISMFKARNDDDDLVEGVLLLPSKNLLYLTLVHYSTLHTVTFTTLGGSTYDKWEFNYNSTYYNRLSPPSELFYDEQSGQLFLLNFNLTHFCICTIGNRGSSVVEYCFSEDKFIPQSAFASFKRGAFYIVVSISTDVVLIRFDLITHTLTQTPIEGGDFMSSAYFLDDETDTIYFWTYGGVLCSTDLASGNNTQILVKTEGVDGLSDSINVIDHASSMIYTLVNARSFQYAPLLVATNTITGNYTVHQVSPRSDTIRQLALALYP